MEIFSLLFLYAFVARTGTALPFLPLPAPYDTYLPFLVFTAFVLT